jgi:superfamily II DNA or RNA helicase/HKD family nuclease
MANNFITNNASHKTLKGRLNTLISISDELKFLVGFFYFSGWQQLFESLKQNETVKLKLLVGLQVDQLLGKMAEHGQQEPDMSQDDVFHRFMSSLGNAINNEEMDNEAFYHQVQFFLQMMDNGRLLIRKTENSNHAKLYLFRLGEQQAQIQDMEGQFVTGSSNLTKAGLSGQEEFNVEIKDYGFGEAEQYFDELWERGIPITEEPQRKEFLKKFIEHRSHAATVTPFEAYVLILKTYLDLQHTKQIKPHVEAILEDIGFKKFSYQTDAVNQALSIIDQYRGVIIADVVGLGKSVIATMIAKNIGKRGMVICPPGLIGERSYRTGWWGYLEDFKMGDWLVESRGILPDIAETIDDKGIEVVIIDEAHYFRNQDTEDYEALLNICRNRIVILLTATPFNNSPTDIFSLLKLFIVPGQSGITIEDNLEALFRAYNYRFKQLSDISKYHNDKDPEKIRKAEFLYTQFVDEELPIDLAKVRAETKTLANHIKGVISPVVIRRNRLDLKQDHQYSKEVGSLSEVRNPKELFFYLSKKQAEFYDRILGEYFIENGRFKGAIYQPFTYEKIVEDEEKLDEAGNRAFIQQRNLFDFMRRLLVKRFESSFGAFSKSIDRFIYVHEVVQTFIKTSENRYILDRKFMERLNNLEAKDEEELDELLHKFENDLLNKKVPKNNTVYNINEFQRKDDFLADIENDRLLFEEIKATLKELDIIQHDPKRDAVYNEMEEIVKGDKKKRKVIIFSEYVDTILHLEPFLRKKLGNRLLVCSGKVSKQLAKQLQEDFNAQHKGTQTDHFDVLITSDKLAEGFNLNRAGAIINYDIPWNPTRVIQRVGRINRIGAKVYDELFIYNFFPSVAGADVVKSREIAQQKMFLIHSALGEDAKIFHSDEEPSAAKLYERINESPDEDKELNISTVIRNKFNQIEKAYPDVVDKISDLPSRVKSSKAFEINQLCVLRKKGLSLFAQVVNEPSLETNDVTELTFEGLLPFVECEFDEPRLNLSERFWTAYETVKEHKPKHKVSHSELSLENKALANLKIAQRICDPKNEITAEFLKVLIKDIRKYRTLSSRTLGRIGRKELTPASSEKVKKAFFDEIDWVRHHLGADYLDILLRKVEHQKNEVIIAVENQ